MIKGNLKTLKTVISNYNFITLEAPNECYGNLMIDTDDGEVWTDEFCDFTHNEYKVYNDDAIHDVIQDFRWANPCWEKMRKMLISQGVDIGDKLAANIADLKKQGVSQEEICNELDISNKVYNAHSEYTKGEYNLPSDKLSRNARNLRRFRAK